VETYKFRAFISYSRSDRQWAKILQARLERFVLPQALRRIKAGMRFDRRPLKPVFRDEDELVPGQDLPERIRQGLELSEYLVVVCSPRAVVSEWVGKEIRGFIALGREKNILAVVVDGEPNAERHGLSPDLECLPPELRFEPILGRNEAGRTTVNISSQPVEPLWVDWRKTNHRNRPMFLRLVAALLSFSSLDDLVRKDRRYQRRRAALIWSAIGVAACCILGLGISLRLQARKMAIKENETLLTLAQKAAQSGSWESSARYALLAMKRTDRPLIRFDSRTAEDALMGALLSNRRIGPPYHVDSGTAVKTIFAANGTVLVVASQSGIVQFLDPETGKPLRAPLHVEPFFGVGISPDGSLLATSQSIGIALETFKSNVWVWDIAKRTRIKTLVVEHPFVDDLEISPDNKYIAAIGEYPDLGRIGQILDISSGNAIKPDHSSLPSVDSVAFSPDGTLVASGGLGGVRVWNTSKWTPYSPQMKLGSNAGSKTMALAGDNRTLAVGTSYGNLILWDIKGQQEVASDSLHGDIVRVGFSKGARRFGAQLSNGVVRAWTGEDPLSYVIADGSDLNNPTGTFDSGVYFIPGGDFVFLPDDRRMVTVADGAARLWKLDWFDRRVTRMAEMDSAEAFSLDGRVIEILTSDGKLLPLDTQTLSPIGPTVSFQLNKDTKLRNGDRMAFSPNSKLVALVSPEVGTWLVNWQTGEHWRPEGVPDAGNAITFSPDGKLLVTECREHTTPGQADETTGKAIPKNRDYSQIQFWDAGSGKPAGGSIEVPFLADSITFSPDGTYLVVSDRSNMALVFDVKRRVRVASSIKGAGFLAFSPDGKRLLTWSENAENGKAVRSFDRLQLWDIATGAPIGPEWKPDIGDIWHVLFMHDARRVLLFSNQEMQFWDPQTSMSIGAPLPIDVNPFLDMTYLSADDRRLMAFGLLGTFYSWDLGKTLNLRGQSLIEEVCHTVLPGSLSKLTMQELASSPVLNARSDADACDR
jgi:WD40 repeat protein